MARILIAKVGSDAHDMGITVVERWLSDVGHEVINMGLYNTPERIAAACAEERPDIVGLSFLGGEPVFLSGRVLGALEEKGIDPKLVVGGVLTSEMVDELKAMGASAVFTLGTSKAAILNGISAVLTGDRRNAPPEAPPTTGAP